jgi:AcrR family transcriptional regulator
MAVTKNESKIKKAAPGRPRKFTREQLIDLAIDYIDKKGYESLSLRSLGRHAGVLPSTLYTYFDDIDDITFAVIDRIYPRVQGLGQEGAGSPRKQLSDFLLALRKTTLLHPGAMVTLIGSAGWRRQVESHEKILEMLSGLGKSTYDLLVIIEMLTSSVTCSAIQARSYGSEGWRQLCGKALDALPDNEGAPLLRNAFAKAGVVTSKKKLEKFLLDWINDLIDRLLPEVDEL